MTERLAKTASGTRHLRWGREIAATGRAHLEHNYLLTDDQKKALGDELPILGGYIGALSGAVVPYRGFVDNAHVEVRANQRVANYLCDVAAVEADGRLKPYKKDIASIVQGGFSAIFSKHSLSRVLNAGHEKTVELANTAAVIIGSLPASIPGTADLAAALTKAAELLKSFNQSRANDIEPQRTPLKLTVQKAIYELREGLAKMDGRLRTHFSEAFIESLYPELSRKATVMADENDDDDDDSGLPDEPDAAQGGAQEPKDG